MDIMTIRVKNVNPDVISDKGPTSHAEGSTNKGFGLFTFMFRALTYITGPRHSNRLDKQANNAPKPPFVGDRMLTLEPNISQMIRRELEKMAVRDFSLR
jgi:hypothetical protein